ncbi:2TM domain-containing protein [uncultured Hymenobacter sp.]|uniref:2TM domain-containing protein n=1 Tax=uncultured Hymenobacter sp. TaxID=170016 RepID=UPI0035CA07BE
MTTALPTPLAAGARDAQLWRQARAQAQAKFKSHSFVYLAVNALLWVLWASTGREANPLPWPVFTALFWGFGLAIQGLSTYGLFGQTSLAEREYARLLSQRGGQ